jgi:hypothetical protein
MKNKSNKEVHPKKIEKEMTLTEKSQSIIGCKGSLEYISN